MSVVFAAADWGDDIDDVAPDRSTLSQWGARHSSSTAAVDSRSGNSKKHHRAGKKREPLIAQAALSRDTPTQGPGQAERKGKKKKRNRKERTLDCEQDSKATSERIVANNSPRTGATNAVAPRAVGPATLGLALKKNPVKKDTGRGVANVKPTKPRVKKRKEPQEDAILGRPEKVMKPDASRLPTFDTAPVSKNILQPKQSKAAKKLQGARFRMLNEKLYTTDGSTAFEIFSANPDLFTVYHQGFQTQVEKWPVNPVNSAIRWITSHNPDLVVADLGCGEAVIAQSVPNKVHSFDLISPNKHVVACNIAQVPLENKTVDVAVFSLALMGTNYIDYLTEAHRILRDKGTLLVYEVISRINGLNEFVTAVENVGFRCTHRDESNKMFVALHFVRRQRASEEAKPPPTLKPCIYKRR